MKINKPILVLNCSDEKDASAQTALDLYQGTMFQLLKANVENPLDRFELLILSAQYGLVKASENLPWYNQRMPKRTNLSSHDDFASQHRGNAIRLLEEVGSQDRDLIVLMTKDYTFAFDRLLSTHRGQKVLKSFRSLYISRNHRGIGELRGRLKSAIRTYSSSNPPNFGFIRSGISNLSELGYLAAGVDGLGTSLARVNSSKNTALLGSLLNAVSSTKIWIDNGLIKASNSNERLNSKWVFSEYRKIVDSVPRKYCHNLTIVIPDAPNDEEEAIQIVSEHKADIAYLRRKQVDVILPIHKSNDIAKLTQRLMKTLGYPKNVRVGIPCLQKGKALDFCLEPNDIETIFRQKHPKTGLPLFERCHYFGLSDASSAMKLKLRLGLANLYGLNATLDATRTTALFGNGESNLRKGDIVAKALNQEHMQGQIDCWNNKYDRYSSADENRSGSSPFVTSEFYDMLNEQDILDWWEMYDSLMVNHPAYQGNFSWTDAERKEALEKAFDFLGMTREVERIIFEGLKKLNKDLFVKTPTKLTPFEERFETLKAIFIKGKTAVPVQMPLPF